MTQQKATNTYSVCETTYARSKAAKWLWRATEWGVPLGDSFFECLQWSIGDLKRILRAVGELPKECSKSEVHIAAFEAVNEAMKSPERNLSSRLEDIISDHPCLKNAIMNAMRRECGIAAKSAGQNSKPFLRAKQRLTRTFGISAEAGMFCEFVFILQQFRPVERYFEDHLEIQKFGNQRLLAHLLGLTLSQVQGRARELASCGLLRDADFGEIFRLESGIATFWKDKNTDKNALFCRSLEDTAIRLKDFTISPDAMEYAKALLEKNGDAPVHILLYGAPGTGKTTFARSLAKECGLRAWSVTSRKDDDDQSRRASLTACLHMASRHKRSFVLVDEAERLLDTDGFFRDKAWLNDFLEQPGKRVVWISNDIDHIDQAVRRRFTFSIHFEELSQQQQYEIWQQVLMRHKVTKRLSKDRLDRLVKEYQVAPAVIENVVIRAKSLYTDKKRFAPAVECALKAYTTLRHGSHKTRTKTYIRDEFSLDGVCLEGSAHELLAMCHRADDALREADVVRPGSATMLFYGPPGTGKTALARHIAFALNRKCTVKRASDLLGRYVGQTEQLIADAFCQAEIEGAVLIIDEVDTFLFSRDMAQRSWESSMVNEFLTALEGCRGFCICTTNRRENMDAAAMRRFSYKVAFGYAQAEQVQALYKELLLPLCDTPLPLELKKELLKMHSLTPGDFHVVRSQYDSFFAENSRPTHRTLISALKREQTLKVEQRTRRIGFSL